MKSTVDELTTAERKALALLYDMDAYKALEKFARLEVIGLGADALKSQDHGHTKYLSGRASAFVDIIKMLKENYKTSNKEG